MSNFLFCPIFVANLLLSEFSKGGKRRSSRALQPECAAHRALGLVHAFTCFLPGLGLLQGRHFHVSWPAVVLRAQSGVHRTCATAFFVDGRSLFSFLHQVSRQRVVTDAFAIFCTVTRPGLGPFHSEDFCGPLAYGCLILTGWLARLQGCLDLSSW